jgi:hypothetical protein
MCRNYAAAFLANMAAFAQAEANHTIQSEDADKNLKYPRQVNRQILIGTLKDKFISIVLCAVNSNDDPAETRLSNRNIESDAGVFFRIHFCVHKL